MATRTDAAALQKKWKVQGLSEDQAKDLLGLAENLVVVTGKPYGSCLTDVDQRVREVLEDRLLSRVADTITYGHDLGK
jgi:hypothetical protein